MLQDLRYAVRMLFRSPGFSATAGLTLALGMGATTLMFSIVNAVMWQPLPFHEPERLVLIFSVNRQSNVGQIRASALDFTDWRSRAQSYDALAGHVGTGFTFSGGGDPELVVGQLVTADFFRVLGVQPIAGRTFSPDEFSPGREGRVILGQRLWQRRFGSDPSVVGSTITINGKPYTVTGVMPASFVYPSDRYEVWAPLPSPRTPEMPPLNRASHYLQVVGRLKPGVTVDQAQTEIAAIASGLAKEFPDTNQNLSARAVPLADYNVRDVRRPLYLLLGAVGLVVLIACGNVTNLLLARATSRTREVAVRQALGAGRARLVRQFLVESIVLYAVGAAGALAVAAWGLAGIAALPADVPRLDQASIDGRVFAATLAVAFVTALIFGIAPALQGVRVGPAEALKGGGRSAGGGPGRQRFRLAVVVAELAMSAVLLVGAGLALRSLERLSNVDPGFDPDGQLTFGIVMPASRYADHERIIAFARDLTSKLSAMPGVGAAGATTHLPLSGQNMENSFTVEGFVPADPSDVPVAGMRGITGDYFPALGVRLVAGRFFTAADREGSQPVTIVNEAFARKFWPGKSAIGKRLLEGGGDEPLREVVGVIADIRHSGPAAELRPEVSIPYSQLEPGFLKTWSRGLWYVVRGTIPEGGTIAAARATVAASDPAMPLIEPQLISELAYEAIAEPRFRTWLLSSFAALAAALATIGVFGVLAYFVSQRTREIGIRVALGATSRDIVRLVMVRGMVVAAVGIGTGVAAAIPLAIWMRALFFEVNPADGLTLTAVSAGLGLVAAVASYVPARRALRIEPLTALKLE